ncbi:MAG: hypothetical protein F6K22_10795 [Okeania sp. SIO2F4]|uniref:hypothetical protein n=1 Tax=Okeania sp. SIO2F4 TaxID=2607790 RepID=UPI00142AD69F|nr:hypothetical protein [Okeania sp. SIO2F4]NES03289.1 hypothetical protein [Okeania sp. SIO2F4]
MCYYRNRNKPGGLAVSAPVAHGGDPQDPVGKSLGAIVRPKRGSSSEADGMLAQLICYCTSSGGGNRQQKFPIAYSVILGNA